MDQFGQNQFSPGMKSSVFVPDQLVISSRLLVTDSGTVTGGKYKRGTVLGMVAATKKLTACLKTANDGSEKPYAILADDVDSVTHGEQTCGLYLAGEFNKSLVTIDASWTLADMTMALRPVSIFLKDSQQSIVS